VRFVRTWWEASSAAPSTLQRCQGALLGLVLGDAVGRLAEEGGRDLTSLSAALAEAAPLVPGADSAMTLAVAESLLECAAYDPKDHLQRCQQWVQTAPGELVPAELRRALAAWKWSRKSVAGSHDPKNVDAHTLSRTLAGVLYALGQPAAAIDLAVDISRTTLQSPVVLDSCRLWAAALLDVLRGESKAAVLSFESPLLQQVRTRQLRPELATLLSGDWTRLGGNGAQALLAAALRALQSTQSFQEGLLRAVSSARQRPTCGALYGAIAGALYGVQQIPAQWRARLSQEQRLSELAVRLADIEAAPPAS
jgi:ADP-ribosyl-[dinitrogen reductase] hydrolase